MAKQNAKSIRFTDEVRDYIEQAPGDGFNQKFENIILEAKRNEPERRKRLEAYEKKIKTKQVQLEKMMHSIADISSLIDDFEALRNELNRLQRHIADILDDSS